MCSSQKAGQALSPIVPTSEQLIGSLVPAFSSTFLIGSMAPAVPLLLNLSGISGYRKTMTLPEISAAITSARTIAKVFKGLMGLVSTVN